MHYNCLLVDDELDLSKMTCEYFNMFNVSCAYVENATQCVEFLQENEVDMLLLDINLARESGFDLCKKLREQYKFPILFISARQSDDDVLIALNIGGDDYIKKPYSLSVLLAKVKVILKRMEDSQKAAEALPGLGGNIDNGAADNGFSPNSGSSPEDKWNATGSDRGIRLIENKLSVRIHGREIPLKAKEFALFKCLYENRNTIVTKESLFDQVWGDCFYSDGTLNVHIRRLREKLEEDPNDPRLIKTVWGTGYILETDCADQTLCEYNKRNKR